MKKLFPTIHEQGPTYIVKYQCLVVLRTRDRYPPVIIMGMLTFIHLLAGSQNIFKSKQLKKFKEPAKDSRIICWFFHENHRFFVEVFWKNWNRWILSFWIFSQNQNRRWYFQNSKNHPILVKYTSIQASIGQVRLRTRRLLSSEDLLQEAIAECRQT